MADVNGKNEEDVSKKKIIWVKIDIKKICSKIQNFAFEFLS